MKKCITLGLLICVMFLGTQTATAQMNTIDINAVASEQTEALRKQLKFSKAQQEEVYKVFQIYTKKKANINNEKMTMEELVTYRDERLKLIFTDEQFKRYTALKKD